MSAIPLSEAPVRDAAADAAPLASLRADFDALRAAWRQHQGLPYGQRMDLLKALKTWTVAHQEELVEAVRQDFGHRSRHETLLAEVLPVVEEIKHMRAHLAEWMEEQPRPVAVTYKPGTARVIWQPLGVVGIIAPWNYPFQLAIVPLAAAICAGCRVLVKPSELTPRTAALFARMVQEVLPPDVARVVQGDVEVGAAFSRLPFDHLFFTGSTSVGKLVMRAAAEHLTPVTLELGGKSPVIVHESFPLAKAAERIVAGKMFNAGQTCISPDYVLVARDKVDALAAAIQAAVAKAYPKLLDNPDYSSIVNDRHHARLRAWLQDARDRGARIVECNPAGEAFDAGTRKMPLTLVLDAPADAVVLQDEIFGPILPLVPYGDLDEAIAYVNDRPRPLSLYCFDRSRKRVEQVVQRTCSGGVTVNDTLFHFMQLELPFGGVGPSGVGAYHGWYGFRCFSHEKGIFEQGRLNAAFTVSPPFGAMVETTLKLLAR